jgi:hypothetical protein
LFFSQPSCLTPVPSNIWQAPKRRASKQNTPSVHWLLHWTQAAMPPSPSQGSPGCPFPGELLLNI